MEDPKLRGTVAYKAVERILGFGASGERMNGVGLSAVSPACPQAFTCALHCWVLCRTLRNARMALEGVGEDPLSRCLACSFTGCHPCCPRDLGHILYLLRLAHLQVLSVCRIFFLPSLHPSMSKHIFYELGVVESMQALEPDDLDWTHESVSFCVTLDKLFTVQEPPVPGSVCITEKIIVIFPLQSSYIDCINPLPGKVVTTLTESRKKA